MRSTATFFIGPLLLAGCGSVDNTRVAGAPSTRTICEQAAFNASEEQTVRQIISGLRDDGFTRSQVTSEFVGGCFTADVLFPSGCAQCMSNIIDEIY